MNTPRTLGTPETFIIEGTEYVPGSELPLVVYRGAVAHCQNEDEIKMCLEANGGWEKHSSWNAFFGAHYHANAHECYGIAAGSSELSIGRGPLDDSSKGQLIKVRKGDVMVLPAGVSHCSSTASKDYRFVVLFAKRQRVPEESLVTNMWGEPKVINVWCRDEKATAEYKRQCIEVAMPETDPVEGPDGYLIKLWNNIQVS